jgi:hypothetical protein
MAVNRMMKHVQCHISSFLEPEFNVRSYIKLTSYGLDGRGSNPGKARFYLLHSVQNGCGSTQPPIQWVTSPELSRPGNEAGGCRPSLAEIKNACYVID